MKLFHQRKPQNSYPPKMHFVAAGFHAKFKTIRYFYKKILYLIAMATHVEKIHFEHYDSS